VRAPARPPLELVRRYNSALQSERQALTREQRGIEARLGRDCGGY